MSRCRSARYSPARSPSIFACVRSTVGSCVDMASRPCTSSWPTSTSTSSAPPATSASASSNSSTARSARSTSATAIPVVLWSPTSPTSCGPSAPTGPRSPTSPPACSTSVVGAPYLPSPGPKDPSLAVFLSQGTTGGDLLHIASAVAKANPSLRVLFRLHPSEHAADYTPSPGVELSTSGNTLDLLARATYQVGVSTTALFEGMALGCRTAVADLPGHEYLAGPIAAGHAMLLTDPRPHRRSRLHHPRRLLRPESHPRTDCRWRLLGSAHAECGAGPDRITCQQTRSGARLHRWHVRRRAGVAGDRDDRPGVGARGAALRHRAGLWLRPLRAARRAGPARPPAEPLRARHQGRSADRARRPRPAADLGRTTSRRRSAARLLVRRGDPLASRRVWSGWGSTGSTSCTSTTPTSTS